MSDMTYCSWTHKLNSEQGIAFYEQIYLKGRCFATIKWSSLWKTSSGSYKSSALLLFFHVINNMLCFMLYKLWFQSLFSFRMGKEYNQCSFSRYYCCLPLLRKSSARVLKIGTCTENMDTWTRIILLATP